MSDVWGQPTKGSSWLKMPDPQPWAVDALCAQIGGDMWHPEAGDTGAEAKSVCRVCPVQSACLQWALDSGEVFGVLGGLSARERSGLKRGQPLSSCAVCGSEFVGRREPTRGQPRRYCSDDCRRKARRAADRAYEARRSAKTGEAA